MRISLLKIWKDSMLEEQRQLLPTIQRNYNDKGMQSSFEFKKNLKIVFIADKRTMATVKNYNQLPNVSLTDEEQDIAYHISQDLSKKGNYDGLHILVSDLIYDDVENRLYVEARKTTYSVLCGLNGKFPPNSPLLQQDLYGIGVLVPLVSNNGHAILLQSNKYSKKNYATVAGFVEPKTPYSSLTNIIEKTAKQELMEEMLEDSPQANSRSRLPIPKLEVSCLSFRKREGARGFIEFYLPALFKANSKQLTEIVRTNQAPDRNEHTGVTQSFDLESNNRWDIYAKWSAEHSGDSNCSGGKDQYPLVISQASRVYNESFYGDQTQHVMPESSQKTFPVGFFIPKILVRPSCQSKEKNINNKEEFKI